MKQLIIGLSIIILFGCKEVKKNNINAAQNQTANISSEALKIIPISHASAVIETASTTLFIDPVGDAKVYTTYAAPDILLITDIHGDHFSLETLIKLKLTTTTVIVPKAVADKFPDSFAPKEIIILNNGEHYTNATVAIEAIPMYNLRPEAATFHVKGRGNGYVISMAGERLYFSGDTEDIPEMRKLKNIDRAFVCMNLPYTMTEERAASAVLDFKPKKVYPYHYRGRPDVSDVEKFKQLVNKGNSAIEVVQLDWYPNEMY